ncbi:ABC transporter permease [Humisphaera borealis]|uniref:FtsX-like permease family protein n=1 Tax=Humisphaera borealis TaxID=2807512 RepID=A0A7M2X2B7_9BACT|nr:ABC transporter permease [Humisphaera borealis]QOV91201.1 FtsX-like permease family protein [Humisphaera borealis]
MNYVAFKMLTGDRAKYLGIVFGVAFASLLITQQAGIFVGLMSRTYGAIEDAGQPDIWVMEEKVQFIDDVKPMSDTELYRVRGVAGVEWAVPLYRGLLKARLDDGNYQACFVSGLDDETLTGGPPEMLEGKLSDLRQADAIIVNDVGAAGMLAKRGPNGQKIPLKIGDVIELNDHRAKVVGICRVSRTFNSQPSIFTTYTRATTFAPFERKLLSFVLVKAKPGITPADLCQRIREDTGLGAYTQKQFIDKTYNYFFENTGIPINFGISVTLGFFVGVAIAGQTFYQFTLENLKHFGALKAMGAGNVQLLKMILLQAGLVGGVGYGIGVGVASVFGYLTRNSELSFLLPWWLMIGTAGAVLLICLAASALSLLKVLRLEPAIVFK